VGTVRGAARGVCQPNGTAVGAACAADGTCTAPALGCHTTRFGTTCGTLVPAGAGCNVVDNACPAEQSCLPSTPGGTVGTCVPSGSAAGTACRAGASECDAPLFCIVANGERACHTVAATSGGACGAYGACSFSDDCVALVPGAPYQGVCLSPGTEGGPCNLAGSACQTGLSCTNASSPMYGRCVRTAPAGQACDLLAHRARCATGTTCVRQGTSGTDAVCLTTGTAPGTACRTAGAACDAGMTCVPLAGGGGVCQRDALAGGACDPRFGTVRCAAGQVCLATAQDTGACSAFVREVEPDDAPESAFALSSTPVAFVGSLDANDLDCTAVDVPANGVLFASVTGPDGRCPGSLALDLYRSAPGRPVQLGVDSNSGAFNCPRIEGASADFPWAANLVAGRYLLCVREVTDRHAVGTYVMSVGVASR
jgi:hypothetical protein